MSRIGRSSLNPETIGQLLQKAVGLHQQGSLREAAQLYARVMCERQRSGAGRATFHVAAPPRSAETLRGMVGSDGA